MTSWMKHSTSAVDETFYFNCVADIDMIEAILSSYATESDHCWCDRCREEINMDKCE